MDMIYLLIDFCTDARVMRIMYLIKTVLSVIFIVVPIILIASLMITVVKAVLNADDQTLAKVKKSGINKVIAAIVVFLVPTLVAMLMDMIGFTKYRDCFAGLTNERVRSAETSQNNNR